MSPEMDETVPSWEMLKDLCSGGLGGTHTRAGLGSRLTLELQQ